MQTLVQAICKKGPSLRDAIVRDPRIEDRGFVVSVVKQRGRTKGWAKLHSMFDDRRGAVNVEWDADASVLLCRVVTRGGHTPHLVVGDLVDYLIRKFKRRIVAIHVFFPR